MSRLFPPVCLCRFFFPLLPCNLYIVSSFIVLTPTLLVGVCFHNPPNPSDAIESRICNARTCSFSVRMYTYRWGVGGWVGGGDLGLQLVGCCVTVTESVGLLGTGAGSGRPPRLTFTQLLSSGFIQYSLVRRTFSVVESAPNLTAPEKWRRGGRQVKPSSK